MNNENPIQDGPYFENDAPSCDVPVAGRNCAWAAIEAAGSDPTDCEGNSLLPDEPQQGDWEYLEDQIRRCEGREPTDEERDRFEQAYVSVMEAHADPDAECHCPICDPDPKIDR